MRPVSSKTKQHRFIACSKQGANWRPEQCLPKQVHQGALIGETHHSSSRVDKGHVSMLGLTCFSYTAYSKSVGGRAQTQLGILGIRRRRQVLEFRASFGGTVSLSTAWVSQDLDSEKQKGRKRKKGQHDGKDACCAGLVI